MPTAEKAARTLTPTSTRATSEPGGFTLIELALVLAILGVMLAVAVPRLELGGARLDASARRLARLCTYLADEASLRGRVYRLVVDLDGEAWQVSELTGYAADGEPVFEEPWDPLTVGGPLPTGVGLAWVGAGAERATTGTEELYFLPEGSLDGFDVMLEERAGNTTRIVRFAASTGRAHVLSADEEDSL